MKLPWGPLEAVATAYFDLPPIPVGEAVNRDWRAYWTAKDLADLLGVNHETVRRWRTRGISPERADEIATRFGYEPEQMWPEWEQWAEEQWLRKSRECAAPECDERFVPVRSNQRYCSKLCKDRVAQRRMTDRRRPARPLRSCAAVDCSNLFKPKPRGKQRIYCSSSCRNRTYRLRDRGRFPERDAQKREYRRAYYQECRRSELARQRRYYLANREREIQRARDYRARLKQEAA